MEASSKLRDGTCEPDPGSGAEQRKTLLGQNHPGQNDLGDFVDSSGVTWLSAALFESWKTCASMLTDAQLQEHILTLDAAYNLAAVHSKGKRGSLNGPGVFTFHRYVRQGQPPADTGRVQCNYFRELVVPGVRSVSGAVTLFMQCRGFTLFVGPCYSPHTLAVTLEFHCVGGGTQVLSTKTGLSAILSSRREDLEKVFVATEVLKVATPERLEVNGLKL